MHDLSAVAASCKGVLEGLGIALPHIRAIEASKRARRTWGTCRRYSDGTYRITISTKLLDAPREALENTLYHELLHAATGCTGHTGAWKQLAAQVNAALGIHISRTASWAEKGLDQAADPTVRYRFVCVGCGAEVIRFRACPFTKRYKRYRCSRCGCGFTPVI